MFCFSIAANLWKSTIVLVRYNQQGEREEDQWLHNDNLMVQLTHINVYFNHFIFNSDQKQSSPFKLWELIGGTEWRIWHGVSSWDQSFSNDQFSQLK